MNTGDAAAWVGAVGTVAAFVAAFWQIHTERVNRQQREANDAEAERRSQAELVSAWYGGYVDGQPLPDKMVVLNDSSSPVYMAVVTLVLVQGAGPTRGEDLNPQTAEISRVCLGVVPPGRWKTFVQAGWGGMSRRPGIEVAFTDRRGAHWVRRATGALEELTTAPLQHMAVSLPADLETAEPDS